MRYTGSSFLTFNLPGNPVVQGLWGSSASNVFAVTSQGRVYSYPGSGSSWTTMSVPGGTRNLDAIAGSSATMSTPPA